MTTTASGISTTTVTTDQQAPLGFQLFIPTASAGSTRDNEGPQTWTYVHNDAAAATPWAIGHVVIRDPSATTNDWYGLELAPATTHTPSVMVAGVVQHVIASGSYGFVLSKGVGLVLSGSAGVAVDSPFTTGGSAAGTVLVMADDTALANVSVIGHTATLIGAGVTGTVYLNCLGA